MVEPARLCKVKPAFFIAKEEVDHNSFCTLGLRNFCIVKILITALWAAWFNLICSSRNGVSISLKKKAISAFFSVDVHVYRKLLKQGKLRKHRPLFWPPKKQVEKSIPKV